MCRSKGQAVAALARLTVLRAELGCAETGQDPDRAADHGGEEWTSSALLPSAGAIRTVRPSRCRLPGLAWTQGDAACRDRIRFMTMQATNSDAKTAVVEAIRETAAQRDRLQGEQHDAGEASWRDVRSTLSMRSRPRTTRSSPSGHGSASCSAAFATWKPNGPQDAIHRVTTENTTLKQRVSCFGMPAPPRQ